MVINLRSLSRYEKSIRTPYYRICNFPFVLLTGLGIVLGQFFPLFYKDIDLEIQRLYWFFLLIILLAAFILSLFMAARMMLHYARPIDEVTKTANRIAQGDFLARTPTTESENDNELTMQLTRLRGTMQEMSLITGNGEGTFKYAC